MVLMSPWLDVTDSVSIKGDGYQIAQEISSRMKGIKGSR